MSREPEGPFLHRPGPPLAQHIDYIGHWKHDSGAAYRSTALPRGAVTIVIELSDRQHVDIAAVGRTPVRVPSAFIAGTGTTSYVTQIDPGQTVMTVHFRPAGARPFLGMPMRELQDRCIGIEDVWGTASLALREQLTETPSATGRLALVQRFLLDRMQIQDNRIPSLLSQLDTDPSITVAEVGTLTGLSPKRLSALFAAEVGLAPKAYLRVRRLQAALCRLADGSHRGADIAAELGYFDQAHFVRDFRSFTAITPSQYAQRRSSLPSHVDVTEMYKPAPVMG